MGKESHTCAHRMFRNWHGRSCRASAKHFENGKWWCNNHLPSNVAKKNEARKKWCDLNSQIRTAQHAVEDAQGHVVKAAIEAKAGDVCCDSVGDAVHDLLFAREALKKLKGEVL